MDILIQILQLILSLSVLVIVHEFGHFAAAKIFHTKVEKFYLFFNPGFSLFKFKYGETEYGMGWLPLGGYVKIAGMIDESMDKEQMEKDPEPWEFRSKPAWQRLIIMLGGVFMNVILAMLIYIVMMASYGEEYLPTSAVKYGIQVDSLGQTLGLKNGDKILTLDGQEVDDFMKIPAHLILEEVQAIQIDRNGQRLDIPVSTQFVGDLIASEKPGFLMPRMPIRISEFAKSSTAEEAGIMKGDWIQSLNGQQVAFFDQFQIFRDSVAANTGKMVQVSVLRENKLKTFEVAVQDDGLIGISIGADLGLDFDLKSRDYTVIEAIPAGINKAFETINSYLKQLKILFNPEMKAYKSVGGFIKIGSIFPPVWDWMKFWSLTAFLSIMLAVLNILPIPALDGGHVMFLMYEIIARRKPSDKFMEYAQMVGMFLLLALLVFANGNDIWNLFN
ncbi:MULTISPECIES: RIP metalloprotease RseP [unclassified Lentimicrobium]|uniref:RIP metalloprotease RseP n=1 Tax=unclassified Lentimicrobium TaxID=2677434 RepID=UPI0015570166|nr:MULTISPECIES: RIP metalloprotease RseP [unclassified Lentimicrobium]NPD44228.1 RIP metalloprotease RseP [Lentimicrobium sp. S6]NPD85766.1 RIP metalloprotease RseP [Lentimicrobium sp. L6]